SHSRYAQGNYYSIYSPGGERSLIAKRKIPFLIILPIYLILLSSFCLAGQEEVAVWIDNDPLKTETSPVLMNGRIFLPARDIVEALGGRITWFPALKLLNINLNNQEISVVIDVNEAEINGKKISLETAPMMIYNRVMIPIEIIQLLMEVETEWDSNSKELNIIRKRPFISSIRSYTHPDKTRIVIDVTEQTRYQVITLSNPDRIVVDLDASISKLKPEQKEILIDDSLVDKVRAGLFNPETVRVVLDLKSKYEYQVFELAAPQRVVVDIFMPQGQQAVIPEVIKDTTTKEPMEKEKIVVVIDPGHGGKDPGAIGVGGTKEKDVVLDIALKLKKLLQDNNITVYLTRDKDIDVPLENRPLVALQKEASIFISIHVNSILRKGSTSAGGIETYVLNSRYIGASAKDVADRENKASQYHNYEDDLLNQIIADLEESASINFSLDFADVVQRKLIQNSGLENRGVKQAPFIVLKGVNMAAVLIEVGFVSNPNEEKLLKTQEFRAKIAQALYQSVTEYMKNMPESI
ncbi:MAG: N-acetylmuramoyl-L-alanine amidase, partial [Candidatus Atribacteria bacterium]|nr:N-acetylmuramoyl-L-alanine amidase [Candidatus Atribacteria bacterium]